MMGKLELLFERKERWMPGRQQTHVFHRMGLLAWFQCRTVLCRIVVVQSRKERNLGQDSGREEAQ